MTQLTQAAKNKHHPCFKFLFFSFLLLLMGGLFLLYRTHRPNTAEGTKHLTIEVIYPDSASASYSVTTDAEYLEEAAAEIGDLIIDGERTEQFGLMILSVNGVEADYARDHSYWAILSDGVPCNYGISQQPVLDGESYQLVYTIVQ